MIRSLAVRALGRPAGFVAAHLLRLSARPVGAALMYHRVAARGGDPAREIVPAHSAGLFESQLRHLRGAYRAVPASRLVDEAARRRRGQRIPVAVTFDDDLACHRAVALPILTRLGVPATFFLSGASLERPYSFWWERLQRAGDSGASIAPVLARAGLSTGDHGGPDRVRDLAPLIEKADPPRRDEVAERLLEVAGPDPDEAGMRSADVRALAQAGFEIGFHTLRHYRLTGLDDDQLRGAMSEGREPLAELTGGPAPVIAYPHGKADDRVASAARAAGYEAGFISLPGALTAGDNPLLLPRLEPSFASAGHFASQLAIALAKASFRRRPDARGEAR